MMGRYYCNEAYKHGEQLPYSKLNDKAVKDARIKYCNGIKGISELAEDNNVAYDTMYKVIRGMTWKHVSMPFKMIEMLEQVPPGKCNVQRNYKRGVLPKNTLLTNKQANRIRYLFSVRKLPISAIAESYYVRYDVVYKIVYGYTFSNAGGPVAKKSYARGESATC
jgi:predicted DNA-binding protein YlxM (UPF0122 family)